MKIVDYQDGIRHKRVIWCGYLQKRPSFDTIILQQFNSHIDKHIDHTLLSVVKNEVYKEKFLRDKDLCFPIKMVWFNTKSNRKENASIIR
ncbi:MAG: hypothetical protein BAJALOKI3v1_50049 [Promethearchaeota archaeon]|nr:MAG: hypothetical protein BAJALOKI3v1_50049 [Candidatus Lokiarchaeota archaeon]